MLLLSGATVNESVTVSVCLLTEMFSFAVYYWYASIPKVFQEF